MVVHDLRSPNSDNDHNDNTQPDGVKPNPKVKDHPWWWWMVHPLFDHKAHHPPPPPPTPPDIGSGAGIDDFGPGPASIPGNATITGPTPTSTGANDPWPSGANDTLSSTGSGDTGTFAAATGSVDTVPNPGPTFTNSSPLPPTLHVNTGIAAAVAICTMLLFVIAVLLFARSYSIRRRRRMTTTTHAWASRRLWFSTENAARESHGPSSTTGWDFGTETSLSMRQSINDFATVSGHTATMSTSSSSGVPSSWGAFGLSRPQSALSSWTRSSSRVATSDTSSR